MSYEYVPVEAEEWAGQELAPMEELQFVGDASRSVLDLIRHDPKSVIEPDDSLYTCFKQPIELCDDNGAVDYSIKLEAIAFSWLHSFEGPITTWQAKIHLDEKLETLAGYPKPASIIRRTYLRLTMMPEKPFLIVRTHELKRRSDHKFYKPKNDLERVALDRYTNFTRTHAQHQDAELLQAIFEAAKNNLEDIRPNTDDNYQD